MGEDKTGLPKRIVSLSWELRQRPQFVKSSIPTSNKALAFWRRLGTLSMSGPNSAPPLLSQCNVALQWVMGLNRNLYADGHLTRFVRNELRLWMLWDCLGWHVSAMCLGMFLWIGRLGVMVLLFKKGKQRMYSSDAWITLLSLPKKVYARVLEKDFDLEKAFDHSPQDLIFTIWWWCLCWFHHMVPSAYTGAIFNRVWSGRNENYHL